MFPLELGPLFKNKWSRILDSNLFSQKVMSLEGVDTKSLNIFKTEVNRFLTNKGIKGPWDRLEYRFEITIGSTIMGQMANPCLQLVLPQRSIFLWGLTSTMRVFSPWCLLNSVLLGLLDIPLGHTLPWCQGPSHLTSKMFCDNPGWY